MELGKRTSILFKFDECVKELGWSDAAQVQVLKMMVQEAENFGPRVLEDRLEDFYNTEKAMSEIVEGVKMVEEELEQQDEGWDNEGEEEHHSSTDV